MKSLPSSNAFCCRCGQLPHVVLRWPNLINHWQPHCWPTPSTIFFPIPNGKVVSQPTQVSLCLSPKLVIQFEGCLLPPLLDALVIKHILP